MPRWMDYFNASVEVARLNRDDPPSDGSHPRQEAVSHIYNEIRDIPGPTVGSGVAAAIEAIRTVAGERGARHVNRCFEDPALTEYYRLPANHPQAKEAHRAIAEKELRYWQREDARRSTPGTRAGASVNVDTRVSLQRSIGTISEVARGFQEAGVVTNDQFAHGAGGLAEAARHRPATYASPALDPRYTSSSSHRHSHGHGHSSSYGSYSGHGQSGYGQHNSHRESKKRK